MVDSIETPVQPSRSGSSALARLASRRGLIGTAGVFSVLAGGLIGAWWLQIHRAYWQGEFDCSASLTVRALSRHSLTVMAITTAIVALIALARIGMSGSAPRRRLVGVFWVASVTLWFTLAVMALASVETRACLRGLG